MAAIIYVRIYSSGCLRKSMKEMTKETMPLRPNERLAAISKEYHTRKKQFYIAEDKLRDFLICSQRLSDLVEQINSIVAHKPDQVSLTGLYQILTGQDGGRVGGWTKHRWKIRSVDLNAAPQAFEEVREIGFSNAIIVGKRDSYTIASA